MVFPTVGWVVPHQLTLIKTIPPRHAPRSTQCRQRLTETLLPVKLRLCQVDRAKHHNILNYINSISRLSSRKAKRPRYWVLVVQHTIGGGAQFRHNTDFLSFKAVTFAWNSCFSNKFLGYKGFKSPPLPVTSKITHPSCSWAFLSTAGINVTCSGFRWPSLWLWRRLSTLSSLEAYS